jgi:hypothetical protein
VAGGLRLIRRSFLDVILRDFSLEDLAWTITVARPEHIRLTPDASQAQHDAGVGKNVKLAATEEISQFSTGGDADGPFDTVTGTAGFLSR